MPVGMRLGRGELLVGHVDADHLALRPHQLGDQIDVAPRARAEIEHARAIERLRHDDAAAIIFGAHLLMHIGEQRLELAGTSPPSQQAEVFRSFELFRTLP